MRHIVYLGDKTCKPCRDYKMSVIDPLIVKYPDAIEVHPEWDARFAKADALHPVTKVPTVIVETEGEEEFRFSAFLEPEQLESIIRYSGEVLTLEDVIA